MRPIKFRAWNKNLRLMQFFPLGKSLKPNPFESADFEVMQFTGLLDKNGNEIYERDICKGKWPHATMCVVNWLEKRAMFMMSPLDGDAAYDRQGYKLNSVKCEVVGNIYENPKLISKYDAKSKKRNSPQPG